MRFVPNLKHPSIRRGKRKTVFLAPAADGLAPCPMKIGLRTICWKVRDNDMIALRLVGECNCSACKYWKHVFANPWDGFAMKYVQALKRNVTT